MHRMDTQPVVYKPRSTGKEKLKLIVTVGTLGTLFELFTYGGLNPLYLLLIPVLLVVLMFLVFAAGVAWYTFPSPVGRTLFTFFIILMILSGPMGWILILILGFWNRHGQPDWITNEPLRPGPQRDAWLAQRCGTYVDNRQVHIHN